MIDTSATVNIQGQQINNLHFADDIVLLAESAQDLQALVDRVYQNSSNAGLKINISKTEVHVIMKGWVQCCANPLFEKWYFFLSNMG